MATPQSKPGGLRRIASTLAWPLTRFFDPRFRGLGTQVDAAHHDLALRTDELVRRADTSRDAQRTEHIRTLETLGELRELLTVDMEAATEAASIIGATISEISSSLDDLRTMLKVPEQPGGDVADLRGAFAAFLNYATSHRGFAAQKGLWFNPPVVVEHREGDVGVSSVNERIVEIPYVLRALHSVPPGGRVLDVGANESTLALSLAALGYRVTALDLSAYPLEHPLLEPVVSPIEDWRTNERFDAIVCLSTVEHIGIAAYGAEAASGSDITAVARMRDLVAGDGVLVLTTPFGAGADTLETERVYDRDALERLLEGWKIEDLSVAVQDSQLVWRPAEGEIPPGARAVGLVTARPSG